MVAATGRCPRSLGEHAGEGQDPGRVGPVGGHRGACAGGLVVTLVVTRPLTAGVLVQGAAFAVAFPLGYATVGLVLGLRRPPTRSGGCSPPRG
jgi:hypothetical protein